MKRFCFVMLGIVLSVIMLDSCTKDKAAVPALIQRMIDERSYQDDNCYDCQVLYRVDEYLYNGDRAFLFMFSAGGWSNYSQAVLYVEEGFSIGSCHFNAEYPLDNPYNMGGCYEDFIKNGQYSQTVWRKKWHKNWQL